VRNWTSEIDTLNSLYPENMAENLVRFNAQESYVRGMMLSVSQAAIDRVRGEVTVVNNADGAAATGGRGPGQMREQQDLLDEYLEDLPDTPDKEELKLDVGAEISRKARRATCGTANTMVAQYIRDMVPNVELTSVQYGQDHEVTVAGRIGDGESAFADAWETYAKATTPDRVGMPDVALQNSFPYSMTPTAQRRSAATAFIDERAEQFVESDAASDGVRQVKDLNTAFASMGLHEPLAPIPGSEVANVLNTQYPEAATSVFNVTRTTQERNSGSTSRESTPEAANQHASALPAVSEPVHRTADGSVMRREATTA
jgi:hypothetical protein